VIVVVGEGVWEPIFGVGLVSVVFAGFGAIDGISADENT
jgi:hypothetical protein